MSVTRPLFILASSSLDRRSLLTCARIAPDKIIPADIDETPRDKEHPRALAARLSLEKMHAVAAREPHAFILAADTVVGVGRRILPKAETIDDVRQCMRLLSGRRHHVYTGVALMTPESKIIHRLSDSTIAVRILSEDDIDAYVETGDGLGKSGGLNITGFAATFVRRISGSHSGIVGLPLFEISQMLRGAGYKL